MSSKGRRVSAVRAHDVFCLYPTPRGHVAALRGLTLDVSPGERVVVHGPNGSGKTTLMRVLIGELPPSAGLVSVCGVDLIGASDLARSRLRARHIGFVDQHHGRSLRPELTVMDNVALQLRLDGVGAGLARRRAREVLDQLGLAELAPRAPVTLSGGEAQRVAVCAAVAHRPTLVLADEPTGELDLATADEVYDLLATAAAACDAALLVVSHDSRAARIADRIVRIRDGRLSEEWVPGQDESLVVDDRGWLRLPEPLRHRAGLTTRVRASLEGASIRLAGGVASSPSGAAETTAETSAETAGGPAGQPGVGPGAVRAQARGVRVERGGQPVLKGVDLAVSAGTLTVVQGRSGSGKTTLLRILCGLERPDAGSVEVDGIDLSTLDRAQLAAVRRAHIAVAGQVTALVETMGPEENLELVRVARGLPPDDETDWIELLGLTALRSRPVRVLSGGERQRVAVARVLATRAPIAILDEPTSRQDEAHAELVVAALVRAARTGIAVVAASHDPVLATVADAMLDLSSTAG